jgi:hypothetical protein
MRMSTLLDKTSWLRKIVGSLPETLPEILLFETLPSYRFERAIPRMFVGIVNSCPTLSKSECIHYSFEGTRDSRVSIDRFQWPLVGC